MIKSIGRVVVLNNVPFKIEEQKVLRELRIPRSISALKDLSEEHISRDIKNAIDLGYSLIKGSACYRTFRIEEVSNDTERVSIRESDNLFSGDNLLRLLKKCDYATLLVCTIGKAIVEKIDEITGASLADAFYLERVAAWMADYMAEQVGGIVETEIIKNGYKPTFRYAAGYGDWGLEAQSEIMRLTEAEKIGVSVTESFIMMPRFSVSAVIGWERKKDAMSLKQ
ncbi:MAG: hypothetical protein IT393_08060 [Nitrospirae bacterium]|nr:hypothetical protein [Nitrospirota bacterium]